MMTNKESFVPPSSLVINHGQRNILERYDLCLNYVRVSCCCCCWSCACALAGQQRKDDVDDDDDKTDLVVLILVHCQLLSFPRHLPLRRFLCHLRTSWILRAKDLANPPAAEAHPHYRPDLCKSWWLILLVSWEPQLWIIHRYLAKWGGSMQ